MELKIYQPYFISHSTIIEYQPTKSNLKKDEKLSIVDILEGHYFGKK